MTVLRDPADRAWSHYRALVRDGAPGMAPLRGYEDFGAVLDDPVFGWMARDYQARWLATPPSLGRTSRWGLPPGIPEGRAAAFEPLEGEELERRALATLRGCALAGTVDRLDEFVDALGRLVGRPLAAPPQLNVRPPDAGPPAAEAARVLARSGIDALLLREADALLDRTLGALPGPAAVPRAELPYAYGMADPLYGTGWHARVHTPDAGWHRWTGPGTSSILRLPVRLEGPARLEMTILSACDDDAVRSLRLLVQDRPVEHAIRPRAMGLGAVADVRLDPRGPVTLTVEVGHTRHLVDAATGARSPDPAGVAVGGISFTPVPSP